MSGYRQLKQQIKFALNNLNAENEHHTFEAICRNFSRRRLGLNILPATGPVSAGGDQGSDFETYTVLPEVELRLHKGQQVLTKKAGFACTTKREKLTTKVKSDLKTIAERGTGTEIVYFFSVKDIPVATRHKLQDWARETYTLELEIIDGEALSEELALNDLFWIAEEFLQIPAELFPKVANADYLPLQEKWESSSPVLENYADFDEIKRLARLTLDDESLTQDLPFWLQKLQEFLLIADLRPSFKRKVLYEIIVLRMRGMRDLNGWEHFVYDYFDAAPSFQGQLEAQDASVIVSYVQGALVRGAGKFSLAEVRGWRKEIKDYVNAELEEEYPPHIRAILYDLVAQLLLTDPDGPDIEGALSWWSRLTSIVEETPLFPLEEFCDTLTAMVRVLGGRPEFQDLVNRTDKLLAERVGQFAVADKCRDRALQYKKSGDLIRALREFHGAKVNWFAEETLVGSLLSMIFISQIYARLGLLYAAKYHAMVVIYIASRSPEDRIKTLIPVALSGLMEVEYENGEWVHFFDHAEMALRSLNLFAKTGGDKTAGIVYEKALFYSSVIAALMRSLGEEEDLSAYVEKTIGDWGIEELNNELLPRAYESWSARGKEEILKTMEREYKGAPFGDVATTRETHWEANGVRWRFTWQSSYDADALVEQIIAVAQIISAEVADKDLCLLKTGLEVDIEFGETFHIEQRPSHVSSKWTVTLPSMAPADSDDVQTRQMHSVAVAITLLSAVSLLPDARVRQFIDELFESGLTSKAFSGNSYESVYREMTSEDLYENITNLSRGSSLEAVQVLAPQHECLVWNGTLLDQTEELVRIRNRYEHAVTPVRLTLRKLRTRKPFLAVLKKLRSEGWKDWHLLLAIANSAGNYRAHTRGYRTVAEMKNLFRQEMRREETVSSIPVPLSAFTEDALRNSLALTLFSTLHTVGLQLKTQTPSTDAVQHFLSARFKYWENDVEHENFFGLQKARTRRK